MRLRICVLKSIVWFVLWHFPPLAKYTYLLISIYKWHRKTLMFYVSFWFLIIHTPWNNTQHTNAGSTHSSFLFDIPSPTRRREDFMRQFPLLLPCRLCRDPATVTFTNLNAKRQFKTFKNNYFIQKQTLKCQAPVWPDHHLTLDLDYRRFKTNNVTWASP